MVEFIDPGTDSHHERARPDPLAPARSAEFDWPTVFEHLDGEQADDGMVSREQAAAALAALLRFLCVEALTPPRNPGQCLSGIGTRAVAALWSLDPGTFAGAPSQARLASAFGKSHGWLSRPVSEFSREFGIVNRHQQNGRNGEHQQKLRVDFRPVVSFRVPIRAAGDAAAPVSTAEGVQTAADDQNAPTAKQEALP